MMNGCERDTIKCIESIAMIGCVTADTDGKLGSGRTSADAERLLTIQLLEESYLSKLDTSAYLQV
jgi:hypothetical protein